MEVSDGSTGKYWIIFVISLAVMIWMTISIPQWSWLSYPFVVTYLALALKSI